jgi:heme/copper-type cytochrome/quinol oxidase subunit 2
MWYKNKSVLFIACFIATTFYSYSQCAMCRATLESTGTKEQAESLNDGIVYLMAFPYIMVAVVGYVVYRMFNRARKAD